MGANWTEVQNKPQTDGVSNIEEELSMSPNGDVVGKQPPTSTQAWLHHGGMIDQCPAACFKHQRSNKKNKTKRTKKAVQIW